MPSARGSQGNRCRCTYPTPCVRYEPCGCDFCSHTGYYGRIGVFEIMEVNDEIRDLIAENGTTEELERAARNSGMRTLRENGINYVLNGTTSVEEMLKASYE